MLEEKIEWTKPIKYHLKYLCKLFIKQIQHVASNKIGWCWTSLLSDVGPACLVLDQCYVMWCWTKVLGYVGPTCWVMLDQHVGSFLIDLMHALIFYIRYLGSFKIMFFKYSSNISLQLLHNLEVEISMCIKIKYFCSVLKIIIFPAGISICYAAYS